MVNVPAAPVARSDKHEQVKGMPDFRMARGAARAHPSFAQQSFSEAFDVILKLELQAEHILLRRWFFLTGI
jgi:hypothetical protein